MTLLLRLAAPLVVSAAVLAGCASPRPPTPPAAEMTLASTVRPGELRGKRYCEVLLAQQSGLRIAIDVYNTIGLNDCPAEAWSKLDAASLARELNADRVILNGPRYWTIDRIDGTTKLIDPTPRAFRDITMRLAGRLQVSAMEAATQNKPYLRHDVERTTVWVFDAGKRVYELLDADGHGYVMQSYSVQHTAQTEDSLATLGERLHQPAGWSFRSRVLDAELRVVAVDGMAHIVQDDMANTYQMAR